MLIGIAEFFRYISSNEEKRLYYVVPVQRFMPYAYQHSSIRDVATLVEILNLVGQVNLSVRTVELFKEVASKTLVYYHNLYEKLELPQLPEGNIGDMGFFLLLLERAHVVFPDILPYRWQHTMDRLVTRLLERARSDGSMEVFFDPSLKGFEKQSEPFYLPEALIGLMTCRKLQPEAIDGVVKRAVGYFCSRPQQEVSVFYANWQFQLLYHYLKYEQDIAALVHLEQLLRAVDIEFGKGAPTVEVACFVEGLVHAEKTLQYLKKPYDKVWFDKKISEGFLFLNDVQAAHMDKIHGGFTHSLHSHEARLDVAGHVFSALTLYIS